MSKSLYSICLILKATGAVLPLLFCAANISAQGQIHLVSKQDSQPISYATLFSTGGVIGHILHDTVYVAEVASEDMRVHIWALGYDTVTLHFPVRRDTTLWLDRRRIALDTVSIRAYNCTLPVLAGAVKGNLQKRHGKLCEASRPGLPVYFQRALRVTASEEGGTGCSIRKVSLYMPITPYKQTNTIRLRIFDERPDTTLPGHDMLHNEYLLPVTNDGNWYEADILEENIQVKGAFYVGFETMPGNSEHLAEYGVMVQKGPYESYSYHALENVWFQLSVGEDWKRMPNLATKVHLICPCNE